MTIGEAFHAQVARNPGKAAVRAWDGELSYRELDDASNGLADRLWESGVRPGSVVGLYLGRSAAMVVALVAIIKTGGAYLALDHRHPADMRRLMVRDAAATVVLTDQTAAAGLPEPWTAVAVELDRLRMDSVRRPALSDTRIGPTHVAYVAYTSGSTGGPKGVSVPHRAVIRLVIDSDYLPIRGDDVFLQFAPMAFDASTLEIWGPLLNGATLVVAPPQDLTPGDLTAFVRREGVTVLWLTAGLFHQVVELRLADLRGLRYLLAGGDVLSAPHVNRAVATLPHTVLVNGYGPTENTTFTCCHPITSVVSGTTVPIGRPIRATSALVLDDRLQPVAPGETGELYAGGAGVAHGYLNEPALTARRFVPDPFAGVPGARMYATGDLVRLLPDGVLEFLGRADRQVKIRGFRIELGEVESAVVALPGVADAAVVAQRTPSGERRLAAFVVGRSDTKLSTLEIRRHLTRRLPSYAVPSLITQCRTLPLTPNGKVDRTALEAHTVQPRPELSSPYRSPASPVERAVVQLWTDHLGIEGVGADDDFFELGGHSLLGVQIVDDLQRAYRIEISPLSFYLDPTPAGLAGVIERAATAGVTR